MTNNKLTENDLITALTSIAQSKVVDIFNSKNKNKPLIYNFIRVKDGRAIATDMTNFIQIDVTGVADGLYDATILRKTKSFTLSKAAADADDYDTPLPFEYKITASRTIPRRAIKSIVEATDFVSDDDARGSIRGVYIDFDYGEIIGVDGHILYEQPFINFDALDDADKKFSHAFYISKPIKAILKKISVLSYVDCDIYYMMNPDRYYLHIYTSNLSIMIPALDGNYPEYKKVIPETAKYEKKLGIEELIHLRNAVKTLLPITHTRSHLIRFYGNEIAVMDRDLKRNIHIKTVNLFCTESNIERAFDAINLLKILDLAIATILKVSKELDAKPCVLIQHQESNISAVKIMSPNTTFLLMPLRLDGEVEFSSEDATYIDVGAIPEPLFPIIPPTQEPVTEITQEPTQEPVTEPVTETAPEPVAAPVTETAPEPVAAPVTETAPEPVAAHITRKHGRRLRAKTLHTIPTVETKPVAPNAIDYDHLSQMLASAFASV